MYLQSNQYSIKYKIIYNYNYIDMVGAKSMSVKHCSIDEDNILYTSSRRRRNSIQYNVRVGSRLIYNN